MKFNRIWLIVLATPLLMGQLCTWLTPGNPGPEGPSELIGGEYSGEATTTMNTSTIGFQAPPPSTTSKSSPLKISISSDGRPLTSDGQELTVGTQISFPIDQMNLTTTVTRIAVVDGQVKVTYDVSMSMTSLDQTSWTFTGTGDENYALNGDQLDYSRHLQLKGVLYIWWITMDFTTTASLSPSTGS